MVTVQDKREPYWIDDSESIELDSFIDLTIQALNRFKDNIKTLQSNNTFPKDKTEYQWVIAFLAWHECYDPIELDVLRKYTNE